MPEPTNHQDTTPSDESVPTQNSRRLKWRNWLIHVLVIFVVSSALEKVYEHVSIDSIDHVKKANESFVNGVEAVDPFNLARIFYGYLVSGEPPKPPTPTNITGPYVIPQPKPPAPSGGFVMMLWRTIPGAFYTAKTIISQGWISIITAAIALFIGFAFVKDSEDLPLIYKPLLAPLIGCVFVWLLLMLLWIASLLFGWLLAGVQIVAYFSLVVPTVGQGIFYAMAKEREHHVTEKISKGLADKLAK